MTGFIDALDRPGGHIAICLLLMVMGAVGYKFGIPKSEDVIVASLAILGRSMMGTLIPKGEQTTVRTTIQETVPEARADQPATPTLQPTANSTDKGKS